MKFALVFAALFVVALAEDAFEADDEILDSSSKLRIESFYKLKNTTKVENEPDVTLNARLFIRNDTVEPDEYYTTAVKNLKEAAPKVRTVNIFGGHVFYPESGTAEDVKKEIKYTKKVIQALLKALHSGGLKLTSNVFTTLLIVDEKAQKEANVEALVEETYGKDSVIDDSNEDGLELIFHMENTDIHLYVVFMHTLDAVAETKLPHGYMSYARAVKLYLEKVYEKTQAETEKKIHSDDSKLFGVGVKRQNRAGDLHLEDFFAEKFGSNIKDTNPSKDLEELVLSLGVPDNDAKPGEFYGKAVENLKKAAPSLKKVRLDGGYTFNPEKPSGDDIKNEVKFFKDDLKTVFKAFKDSGITVISAKLKVHWFSKKEDADGSGYPALLKEAFGYEPTEADIESGAVLMNFKMDGAQCDVHLYFFDQHSPKLPKGRTSFYKAAELHAEPEQKE